MATRSSAPTFLQLDGKDYVVLPKDEYLRLADAAGPATLKDARTVVRAALAARLRKARQHAGLSQRELAEKLGVSQPMVAGAESGSTRIAERYARSVLKACKLRQDWVPEDEK
jgi:ribosome-binding protein aMBF1 (putative translation factor)